MIIVSVKEKYKVKSIDSFQCKDWLLNKHYAKRIPSIEYSFGLFCGNVLVGVCTFGQPASPNVNKGICGDNYGKYVIELNRLVTDDGIDENCLSYFVGTCLRVLPKPKIVVSYSDSSMHYGYIYQATNFIYTGSGEPRTHLAAEGGKHPRHYVKENEERIEWTPKHRYLYIVGNKQFKKEITNNLRYQVLPYPKGDNKRYDTSYKPNVQIGLF